MQNLQVKRNELKYFISNLEYEVLKRKLSHILKRDIHSKDGGYFIRSLYFDSYDDECLFQKQSGNYMRAKYRMRIYSLDTDIVKFEIKHKLNNQIYKESATISKKSAIEIIDGNYDELLKYHNPILNKIYIKFKERYYKPKVIVDYHRDAFVYDFFNIRITFDLNLHSCNSDFDIFSNNLHTIPVVLEGMQILEIKYENFLPQHIKMLLQGTITQRLAISKYTLSRRYFKQYNWEDN